MKKIIAFSSPIFFLILCLFVPAFLSCLGVAYATDAPVLCAVTAVTSYEIDENGVPEYTRGAIDLASSAYKKDVVVTFDVGEYAYKVFVRVAGSDEVEVTPETTKSGAEVSYRITSSGVVDVTARTYDGGTLVGQKTVTVYSDNDAPVFTAPEGMTEWLQNGQEYVANVDLFGFSDDLSGRGKGYYRVNDGALTEIDDIDADSLTFAMTENTDLYFLFFDNAGNLCVTETSYDKFDSTPPPVPTITIESNVPSSRFARYYTVEIEYSADEKSGLKDPQSYFLNGEKKTYSGPFTIEDPTTFLLTAYAEDNAGNVSSSVAESRDMTTFDVTPPNVISFTMEIDLRKERICTVYASVSDVHSGVSRVYLSGGAAFFRPVTATDYVAEFDCYGLRGLTLIAEDVVGNSAESRLSLNLFGNENISQRFRSFAERYKSTDFSLYEESARAEIEKTYVELNVIAGSATSTESDFNAAAARLEKAYAPENVTYAIEEPTSYLSGMLEYEINAEDFSSYRLGEEIKLAFAPADSDDALVATAGFASGFSDGFSLTVSVGGEAVESELENGIGIKLNLPVGYYERSYALYYGGEEVATEKINNKLEFTLKKNGDYVLVVSGSRKAASNPDDGPKSVTVFGRKLSYGVFFGTVFGIIGGVVLLIGGVILIAKLGRKRG